MVDMNLNKIARLAADECVRQGVGLDRLVMLLRGYEIAMDEAKSGKPSYHMVMAIAKIVEPKSEGKTRTTPVTFANGGGSCPPDSVKDSTLRLFKSIDMLSWPEPDMADEWVRHFLYIHPFSDGNGRMGWILYNWLLGTLDDPKPLPNFFGE